MAGIPKGTWVEIEQIVLTPEQRAPNIPEDTRRTPLMLYVAGFLTADAAIGDSVAIRTLIGRELHGVLRVVNPSYHHSFGETAPELLEIGREVEL